MLSLCIRYYRLEEKFGIVGIVLGIRLSVEEWKSRIPYSLFGYPVCQDYVHIFLSLLRLNHIRCRYVAGLAFSCGETHAWVEIYDGKSWIGMDPTHNCLIGDQYIKLCHGRDFADCPIERGIYRGNVSSTQEIISCVESL